jgi:FMN phosphatase YigB (HAD superfamily)
MIRNVIFDLGGVLVNWRPQEIIGSFYREPHLREAVRRHMLQHPDWLDLDRGTLLPPAAAERFAQRLERPLAEMLALLNHVKASLTPMPESIALATRLRERGLSLYVLSNMSEDTFEYLQAQHAFFDLFDGIVISAAVRLIKPEAEIFAYLAQRYGLAYAETVFIDDHLPNVDAARRLGFSVIHFENPAQCAREMDALLET